MKIKLKHLYIFLESESDIVDWLNCDQNELGYQLFTDEERH